MELVDKGLIYIHDFYEWKARRLGVNVCLGSSLQSRRQFEIRVSGCERMNSTHQND
jgi:hypothetical protein